MKLALVVGGSRGIGRAIALRLAKSGCDIWLTCHKGVGAAASVKTEIEALGRACEVLAFDVADHAQCKAVLGAKLKTQAPDILVFNSGIARDQLMAFMTKEEWDAVLRTNLDGFFNVAQPVIFHMMGRKRGRIIVISSISGQVGQAGQVNYSASKAGLIGAAKALAREAGRKNVIVNVVAPGFVETRMTETMPNKEQLLQLIPLGRAGTPEDVAEVVNFLATAEPMYVHGQVIGVNGGLGM